ncbi:MAG: V-type ATP synthase subunit I [Clostridiales bacterium]|mgnify:CR=1 FL=1|nr:V-type ATP synthase subunit I [Clostridiales bacterium]
MAIVKMNKFTLLVFEEDKEKVLEELQKFQGAEFINLQKEELLQENEDLKELSKDEIASHYSECEEKLSKIKHSLEFLRNYIPPKPMLKALKEGKKEMSFSELEKAVQSSGWEGMAAELTEKEQRINAIDSEVTKIKTEIELLEPWSPLDVALEDLRTTKYSKIFLGSTAKEAEELLIQDLEQNVDEVYIQVVNRDSKNSYFIIISHREKEEAVLEILKGNGFSQTNLPYVESPSQVITGLKESIEKLLQEKEEVINSLKANEEKLEIFEMAYDYYANILLRMEAPRNFLKTNRVVAIAGWTPEESNDELKGVVKKALGENYYLSFEAVEEKDMDDVPIKLKNNLIFKNFENITEMYSMPKYNEVDPTPLLAPFYLIFFGMMVADAGYGALVLIGSAIILKCFKLDEEKEKMLKFFFWLSIPTIVFGILFGSFFGDILNLTPIINPIDDINTVLFLSLGMGLVHIFFGLGIKAYMLIRDGDPLGALYDVGSWVMALVGGGLFIAGGMIGLSATAINIAKYVMIIGMAIIVFMSARDIKNYGARIGSGLYNLYGISGYVGDLVSYTRLMALGLAGGQLANAFNLIIKMIPGWAIFVIGPIFFVFFHLFNIFLSMLGAYVHTCRLQYVEYFGKFYEGGGRSFSPFKIKNNYFQINRD